MHNMHIYIESRETPHTADSKKDRHGDTDNAIAVQGKRPRKDCGRDAEGAEIAERIHLLAELTGHAERACNTPVQAVSDESKQNEECSPIQTPLHR